MTPFLKSHSSPSSSRRSSVSTTPEIDESRFPVNHELITSPARGAGPKTVWKYTKDQEDKIELVRIYAHSLLLPASDPYHSWELRFISDPGCIPRYMRAAKWKTDNAKERIKGTMEWRREFKPELITAEEVREDVEDGKIVVNGFDNDGRPLLIMRPGKEKRPASEHGLTQIKHLVWQLERAIDLAPPGVESISIVIDYASASSQSNPSIGTSRKVVSILQNHYVERMGRAIIIRTPWWVNAFFSAVTPFLDPVTKDKMKFNPKLADLVPPSQLDVELGGENNFQFDPKIWLKEMIEYCHLAPDGGRLDKDGKPCVPPLGFGAKAACYGLAAAGGLPDLEHRDAEGSPAMSPTHIDDSQKLDPMDRILLPEMQPRHSFPNHSSSHVSDKEQHGSAPHPSRLRQEVQAEDGNENGHADAVASRLQGLHVDGDRPPKSYSPPKSGLLSPEAPSRGSLDLIVETKPGPPASRAVFDHPPTEQERRDVARAEGIRVT